MNVSDTEVVSSILQSSGMTPARDESSADVVLVNTCSVRDKAERRVWGRISRIETGKTKVLLGCMAERLKGELEGSVDVIGEFLV